MRCPTVSTPLGWIPSIMSLDISIAIPTIILPKLAAIIIGIMHRSSNLIIWIISYSVSSKHQRTYLSYQDKLNLNSSSNNFLRNFLYLRILHSISSAIRRIKNWVRTKINRYQRVIKNNKKNYPQSKSILLWVPWILLPPQWSTLAYVVASMISPIMRMLRAITT